MLSKTNQDAISKKISVIISDLEKQIEKNTAKMSQIDEEFRLKAEAKKASLAEETKSLTEEVNYWKSTMTDRYGATEASETPEETLAVSEDLFSQVEEETPVIEEEDEEVEEEVDEVEEEEDEDEPEVEEEEPEFDSAGFTDADNGTEEDVPADEEEMEFSDEEEDPVGTPEEPEWPDDLDWKD